MKKNVRRFYRLLMVLLILSAGALFVSCSSTYSENADPKSIISERYGNKTYTINFSSATLSTPVAPMEYTALSIPKLPTPERVGYVFQGWYYDANYLTPYTQDSLYMKMSDVTLYAKWTEEQIVNSGIYGIKCEFTLVEDSLKLSAYAEENGYGDLNDYLIDSEIYMEKADDGLFLRFQFDSGYQSSAETFAFAIAAESGSKFRIASEKTIQIASESKRTYYIDWKNNKIDEPCYLAVTYYNTKAADEGVDVATTAAYYTLRVEIKEFYGFEQSYVKVRSSLDDGWYSVRAFYTKEDGGQTAMSTYYATYTYLRVLDGKYTLILDYSPFLFLGSNLTFEYYPNRVAVFAPVRAIYGLGDRLFDTSSSDWLLDGYDAGHYYPMRLEYHKAERKYYHIFELGEELKKNYMLVNTVTGMMELMTQAYGKNNVIMSLDFDHVLQIREEEVNYKPLTGDAYEYNYSTSYYPGAANDFFNSTKMYEHITEYGISDYNVNYFFSGKTVNDAISEENVYDFSIDLTPYAATAEMVVKDSRYQIAHFSLNCDVYGYTPEKGNLYADSYTTKGVVNSGLRERVLIVNGRSFRPGDEIDLEELYAGISGEGRDFSKVTYRAYAINNYIPDLSKTIDIPARFAFTDSVAVMFTYAGEEGNKTVLYELAKRTAPTVNIDVTEEYLYSEDNNTFETNEKVPIPYLSYTWMGGGLARDYSAGDCPGGIVYVDAYYEAGKYVLHPMHAMFFCVSDDDLLYGNTPSISGTQFVMKENDAVLYYELFNRYNERTGYTLLFHAFVSDRFTLKKDGEIVRQGRLINEYTKNPQRMSYSDTLGTFYADNLSLPFNQNYTIDYMEKDEDGTYYDITERLTLYEADVANREGRYSYSVSDYASVDDFIAALSAKLADSEYAKGSIVYASGKGDKVTLSYKYEIYYNGMRNLTPLPYDTVFTNTYYELPNVTYTTKSGVGLTTLPEDNEQTVNRAHWELTGDMAKKATIIRENGEYKVYFSAPGIYTLTNYVYTEFDTEGNKTFDKYVRSTYYTGNSVVSEKITVEVKDKAGKVKITFRTSAEHPFTEEYGGGTEYTAEYDLSVDGKVPLLPAQAFAASGSTLMGWVTKPYFTPRHSGMLNPGFVVNNFTSTFNSDDVDLYACWDDKITITLKLNIDAADFPEEGVKKTVSMERTNRTSGLNRIGFYYVDLSALFGDVVSKYASSVNEFKNFVNAKGEKKVTFYTVEGLDDDEYLFTAVYAKQYKVKFNIDARDENGDKYSGTFLGNDSVYTGETIKPPTKEIVCKKAGYEFKYWSLSAGGEEYDFSTVITDEMAQNGAITLYAVFGEIEDD